MGRIYLDNAASTKVKEEILTEFDNVARMFYGNPSSEHFEGHIAENNIECSQIIISKCLNCEPNEIYFTSGATMSNNVAIQGFMRRKELNAFLYSAVEHNDIMLITNYLQGSVTDHYSIPVDKDGIIRMNVLKKNLDKLKSFGFSTLVSIQMANSETGIIQPIKEISELVHQYDNFYLHTDATQYLPYYSIDVKEMGIDMLSMSGQKIGGIKGSGLLYVRDGIDLVPIIFGEQGLIGGTQSAPMIASLSKAFELLDYNNTELAHKRDVLWNGLESLGAVLVGTMENRLPNNIYCRFAGVNGLTLVHLLNEYGISIGTGSACSTDSDKPSHVALAYGLTESEAMECVRFTLSDEITYEDIEYVIKTIKNVLFLL